VLKCEFLDEKIIVNVKIDKDAEGILKEFEVKE